MLWQGQFGLDCNPGQKPGWGPRESPRELGAVFLGPGGPSKNEPMGKVTSVPQWDYMWLSF